MGQHARPDRISSPVRSLRFCGLFCAFDVGWLCFRRLFCVLTVTELADDIVQETPVFVAAPTSSGTEVYDTGGIVANAEGITVYVPPEALSGEAVTIVTLAEGELPDTLPVGLPFATAFELGRGLDIGPWLRFLRGLRRGTAPDQGTGTEPEVRRLSRLRTFPVTGLGLLLPCGNIVSGKGFNAKLQTTTLASRPTADERPVGRVLLAAR